LRQREDEVDALDLKVAVVTFEAGPMATAYVEQTGLAWPVLVDEDRSLYEAYGMMRASFWDIWGTRTWIAYAKLMIRGRRPRAPAADAYQRGGDILIDPGGTVRLHHVGDGPADRPEVSSILSLVKP
jgi:hypothetical protein